jgi:hypothetical protein
MSLRLLVGFGEYVDAGGGQGTHHIFDNPTEFAQPVDVVHAHHLVNMASVFDADHAAFGHFHAGRVRDDCLLKGDLSAVSEARNHVGGLAPLLRKSRLRGGVAVTVLQPFDVAADPRD